MMPAQTAARPALGLYEIDPAHSSIRFRTRHMFGLGPVRGSFAVAGGSVDVTEPLESCRVRAEIDVASFRTGNPVRDKTVRSARYLDAERHPVMTFTAQGCDAESVSGTLTVCGVTQPVRLDLGELELDAGAFTVTATTRIDRTQFGVTAQRGMTGRYLDLSLQIRCVRA